MAREYMQIVNDIKEILTTKKRAGTATRFRELIEEIRQYHGVTTKWLKGLMEGISERQKTYRIKYLLKRAGLKTVKTYRYYNELNNHTWLGEIVDYGWETFGNAERVVVRCVKKQSFGELVYEQKIEVLHEIVTEEEWKKLNHLKGGKR